MNTFIRTSDVDTPFYIRKILWDCIYSNLENMNLLIQMISSGFYNTADIEFNPVSMNIMLKSKGRPFDKDNANQVILESYSSFIQNLHSKGIMNNDIYSKCIPIIDKLFFITFDSTHVMKINL